MVKNHLTVQEMQEKQKNYKSGRASGGGNGNPLQYSCLENPMDRGLEGYSPLVRKEPDMT